MADLLAKVQTTITPLGWAMAELPVQAPGSRIRLGNPLVRKWGVDDIPGETFKCIGFFRHIDELVCNAVAEGHPGQHWRELRADLEGEAAVSNSEDQGTHLPPEASHLVAPSRIVEFEARWTSGRVQLDLKVGKEITARLGYHGEHSAISAVTWGGHLVLMSESCYRRALESPIW